MADETKDGKDAAQAKKAKVHTAAVNKGVEAWVDQHLRNTDFSRDTAAWNVLQGALPHLAPMITEEIG